MATTPVPASATCPAPPTEHPPQLRPRPRQDPLHRCQRRPCPGDRASQPPRLRSHTIAILSADSRHANVAQHALSFFSQTSSASESALLQLSISSQHPRGPRRCSHPAGHVLRQRQQRHCRRRLLSQHQQRRHQQWLSSTNSSYSKCPNPFDSGSPTAMHLFPSAPPHATTSASTSAPARRLSTPALKSIRCYLRVTHPTP
jgi:hypothetical protein